MSPIRWPELLKDWITEKSKEFELWILDILIRRNFNKEKCNRFGGYINGRIRLCQRDRTHYGKHDYRYATIYVVTDNYQQFYYWCRDRRINPSEAKYVRDIRSIRGVRDGEFIFYETAWKRKDIDEILSYVRIIEAARGY